MIGIPGGIRRHQHEITAGMDFVPWDPHHVTPVNHGVNTRFAKIV